MVDGQKLARDLFNEYGTEKLLSKGTILTEDVISELAYLDLVKVRVGSESSKLQSELRGLEERTERQVDVIRQLFEEKKEKIRRGDELPPGVIKLV